MTTNVHDDVDGVVDNYRRQQQPWETSRFRPRFVVVDKDDGTNRLNRRGGNCSTPHPYSVYGDRGRMTETETETETEKETETETEMEM